MGKLVNVYVGRQPIFNREMQVYAYELLFRGNANSNEAVILGSDSATAQVVLNAFMAIGMTNLVGSHKAFLNFTEGFLLEENIAMLPSKQLVIEVLETVQPTPAIISSVKKLKEQGYTIALDDFFYTDEYKPLVVLADIIKIDILMVGPKELPSHIKAIRSANPGVKLLAEKVETREQFDFCKTLNCDYFQGYFFAKPQIVKGTRLPTSKMAILELLANVYDPEVEMNKLAAIVGRDVSLSHKLLTFVRTYPGNQNVEINSIKDAIMRFGLQKLQSWVSVLALTGVDDKPHELFNTALIRANFLEQLAEKTRKPGKETYFMVGLFSTLDALMDSSMSDILKEMTINSDAKTALLERSGDMGTALCCALAIEQGNVSKTMFADVNPGDISTMYMHAMSWANSTLAIMTNR